MGMVPNDVSFPVLDRERLRIMGGGMDAAEWRLVLRELVDLYQTEWTARAAALEDACRRGDARGCAQIAHFMTGSAASLGLRALEVQLRELERTYKAGDIPGGAALKEALRGLQIESLRELQREAATV